MKTIRLACLLTLKGTPIWGAARPTPGANLITLTISSIIFWIRSDPISSGLTSRAFSWRTGSPAATRSGKSTFFFLLSPRPSSQPALVFKEEEEEDKWYRLRFNEAGLETGNRIEQHVKAAETGSRPSENLKMVAIAVGWCHRESHRFVLLRYVSLGLLTSAAPSTHYLWSPMLALIYLSKQMSFFFF